MHEAMYVFCPPDMPDCSSIEYGSANLSDTENQNQNFRFQKPRYLGATIRARKRFHVLAENG